MCRTSPTDTWTWQIDKDYQRFAHCVTDALNSAAVHSWFYEAPRPITSFDQQWQRNRIILKSIDPWGVEQVRIEVAAVDRAYYADYRRCEKPGSAGRRRADGSYVRAYVERPRPNVRSRRRNRVGSIGMKRSRSPLTARRKKSPAASMCPMSASPRPGEVVFDVLAFPINPADVSFCRGNYRLRPPLPATPGAEVHRPGRRGRGRRYRASSRATSSSTCSARIGRSGAGCGPPT